MFQVSQPGLGSFSRDEEQAQENVLRTVGQYFHSVLLGRENDVDGCWDHTGLNLVFF